ncbi:MAG: alanine racemase, partial [bacterium]|nr:alanine racemase [bacterium]
MSVGFSPKSNGESGFVTRPYEPLPGLHCRPTYAEIDLAALRSNLQLVRKFAPNTQIMASIKAQAYGHGLLRVAEFLAEEGVDAFGVGFLEEGVWLREAGIDQPVLVLGGIANDQLEHYLEYDLTLACASPAVARNISAAAKKTGKRAKVHLKIDTGMRRLGVYFDRAKEFAETVTKLPGIEIEGLFSHFATSDIRNDGFAQIQLERFSYVLSEWKRSGIEPRFVHMANSGGILNYPASHFNLVRPGLLLYGYRPSPEPDERLTELQPVMSLRSEVLFVKGVRAGEGVSYGLTYRTPHDTWLATIPVGYGDGYNRALSNRASVLIEGKRYPVVGRICMDQLMVDLGKDRIETGTPVTLFGKERRASAAAPNPATEAIAEVPAEQRIEAWELCRMLDTIPYELTCWVSERVPR